MNRNFKACVANRIWVTDFTYVPVYSGFVYVVLVIDLCSRATWLGNLHGEGHPLCGAVPENGVVAPSLANRSVAPGLINHSDYAEKKVNLDFHQVSDGHRNPIPRVPGGRS
ncbi:hypothetical protein [Glutamicibacter ardleyensis]|uniref:hypothetical protein n=1 Tax=Glutamicibacter ardleyensis TaxID=225894 RepID=UPI003FD56CF7